MHDPALLCRDVQKSYRNRVALQKLSLEVGRGRIAALVGPNGAGKTTLLHIVAGIIRQDAGEVRVCGLPNHSPKAKRQLAFIGDDLPRPKYITGSELLRFTAKLHGCKLDAERTLSLARQLDMQDRMDDYISSYSHGMARKLDIIIALSSNAELLLLDEPFSGLDPETVDTLIQTMRTHRDRGGGILLSSHDLELVHDVADEVLMIFGGRIVRREIPARDAPGGQVDLRKVFRDLAKIHKG